MVQAMKKESKITIAIFAVAILLILFLGFFVFRDRSKNNTSASNNTEDKRQESHLEEMDGNTDSPEKVSSQEGDELPIISSEEKNESEEKSNNSVKTKEENSGSDVPQDGGKNIEGKENEGKLPFVPVD